MTSKATANTDAIPKQPDHLVLLRDGVETYPEMLRAIAGAKRSICVQTYVLRSDRTGWRFAEALIERSRSGVEVSLMYDAWGSSISSEFAQALRAADVRTLAFNPLRLSGRLRRALARLRKRSHRKMLVVDCAVAFVGGTNLSDDYAPPEEGGRGWRDTNVRVEGPAAQQAQALFAETWLKSGGEPFRLTRVEPAVAGLGRVRLVGERLHADRRRVRDAYLRAIASARRTIHITNAYFLPTHRVRRALARAAHRGVQVLVILPGTTDLPIVRLASQHLFSGLLRRGIRLFEWTGPVLHAKTAAVDNRWATVGSSNLDPLSLRVNLEANVVVEDQDFARKLEGMFLEDLARCREILTGEWARRPPILRFASWIAYRFRRWL